jgi:predicted methyltransferase
MPLIGHTTHIVTVLLLTLMTACGPATQTPAPAQSEAAVPDGINDRFLDPDLDPDAWTKRWEVESREIYVERVAIAAAVQLRAGEDVADVGAGTGLFLAQFSRDVGAAGHVYAVEISPRFVEHIQRRAATEGLANVEAVLSREDSTTLPRGAVDAAFLCDTYHHFADYETMLRSLRETIRPGGRLVIVDFERIPGVSREWVLGHVRTGKAQVIAEVETAGFELEREITIPELRENYVLRFRRP